MTIEESRYILNGLQLGDKGRPGTLRHLAFVIGENMYSNAKNSDKEKVVSLLSEYYGTPGRFNLLWERLTDAERSIISFHIWGNGCEPGDCADKIAKDFRLPMKSKNTYYIYARNGLDSFKEKYADNNSVLWLLFPRSGGGNQIFYYELREAVGDMKRVYSKVSNVPDFFSRENRTHDFANIVRCCNSNKLTITKNGMLSKSSALKLRDFCGYEEYAAEINATPEDMRTTEGLLVTHPLFIYCVAGGLLVSADGTCVPGGKAFSLISLPKEQLVKKLFEAFLKSRSFDEISIIKGIKSKRGHNPTEARKNISEELKHCPIGQAVYTKELERHLRIANKAFARKNERYVIETGNNYYDYGVEWEQYEQPLIDIILSFFGALGVLDIAWGEDTNSYTERGSRAPIAFRINPLGEYVLGLSDSYNALSEPKMKTAGGFTVLPDYTIVLPDSLNRLKHELYFEKLFTKLSATDEASIYKLDFETVARAVDNGMSVDALRSYLSASDKPMPENVAGALNDWEKQTGRIRLRQVTILECDDAALLEEVIRYKGMGALVKEKISAAVVIEDGATNKVKKVIEKNKRFCKDVI